MEKFILCRVCLSHHRQMSEVMNVQLQEVYQKLTGVPFQSEDMKPLLVCYICRALLCRAHSLMMSCVHAEKLLSQMLKAEDVTPLKFSVIELSINTVIELNIEGAFDRLIQDGGQTKDGGQIKDGLHVKEETQTIEIPTDYEKDYKFNKTIQDNISNYDDQPPSDPEDDLPLTTIKDHETTLKRKKTRLKDKKNRIKKKTENKIKRELKEQRIKKEKGIPTYSEIELTKEEQLKNLLERAKSDNYTHSPFKCQFCYKGFVDATAFENHNERHDERSGAFACSICGMRYRSERARAAHSLAAHARVFRCTQCAHVARTANQAKVHEKWHTGFKYECKLCGREFRKPTTYLSHLRKSHPSEHVCEVCGDSFVGLHGLKMHKTKAHYHIVKSESSEPASERYCGDCNIQFHTRNAWLRHIVYSYKHSSKHENSAQCEICGWSGAAALRRAHVRSHARALRDSRRAAGATPTPGPRAAVWCQQCGASFSTRSKLDAHVKRVHLGLKYNKNVVCEVCGKKCTSNATLKYHQRTHTGERPYACATCGKTFADSNQLRIHTRTHTGERPYVCAHCGKRFSQKPALNRHYRVHTGAKPFTCQLCLRTFSQSNSLKLHVRTVHSKQPADRKHRQKPQTADVRKQEADI